MNDLSSSKNILLTLFHNLLTTRVNSLADLFDERHLYKVLLEIEPQIEAVGGKIEIIDDSKYGIKYANFVSIINCIKNYFEKSHTKTKFLSDFNINKMLMINDLSKNDEHELVKLGEILLVISSITSKDNYYLDKLFELDENIQTYYLNIIEKYIEVGGGGGNKKSDNKNLISQSSPGVYITELEHKVEQATIRYNDLEKEFMELNLKHKDAIMEIGYLKSKHNMNIEVQEELIKDTILNNQLKNDLEAKENELDDCRKDLELAIKRHNEEKMKMKEKLTEYEDKIVEFKTLHAENERLKSKIKEYNILKDKIKDYDDLVITLEYKNKQIEKLISEKQTTSLQIEKLNKEIAQEKERCRNINYEKKKFELELMEVKDASRYMDGFGKKRTINNNMTLTDIQKEKSFTVEKGKQLNMLDESLTVEVDKKEEREVVIKNLEKDLQELTAEKADLAKLIRTLTDQNNELNTEKAKLQSNFDEIKFELEKLKNECDKITLDKEKAVIAVQRQEIEYQKAVLNIDKIESERKKLEDDLKEVEQKNVIITQEKNLVSKEIDSIKKQLNQAKDCIEKIVNEKQNLINKNQSLQAEYDKLKNSNTAQGSTDGAARVTPTSQISNKNLQQKPSASPDKKANTNYEAEILKSDIQHLKFIIRQKDESIKSLNEKIKILQLDKENLIIETENKKSENLEFYKKSYEEQKYRLTREHELVAHSLYELTLQFMALKNELQKRAAGSGNIPGEKAIA